MLEAVVRTPVVEVRGCGDGRRELGRVQRTVVTPPVLVRGPAHRRGLCGQRGVDGRRADRQLDQRVVAAGHVLRRQTAATQLAQQRLGDPQLVGQPGGRGADQRREARMLQLHLPQVHADPSRRPPPLLAAQRAHVHQPEEAVAHLALHLAHVGEVAVQGGGVATEGLPQPAGRQRCGTACLHQLDRGVDDPLPAQRSRPSHVVLPPLSRTGRRGRGARCTPRRSTAASCCRGGSPGTSAPTASTSAWTGRRRP